MNVIDTCLVRNRQRVTKSTGTRNVKEYLFPYEITHRSFAPWREFGDLMGLNIPPFIKDKRFWGDNRGFSLDVPVQNGKEEKITSRLNQVSSIMYNRNGIMKNTEFADVTIGHASVGIIYEPVPYVSIGRSAVQSRAEFTNNHLRMEMSGKNPLVWPAPKISWKLLIDFRIINVRGQLKLLLNCKVHGKGFPAYEAFIHDSVGAKFFIFAIPSPPRKELASELMPWWADHHYENTIIVDIDNNGKFLNAISISNSEMIEKELPDQRKLSKKMTTLIQNWNEFNFKRKPAPDCSNDECNNVK